jgi:hypothetical protein
VFGPEAMPHSGNEDKCRKAKLYDAADHSGVLDLVHARLLSIHPAQ